MRFLLTSQEVTDLLCGRLCIPQDLSLKEGREPEQGLAESQCGESFGLQPGTVT